MGIIDIHTHNTQTGTASIVETARRNGIDNVILLGDVLRLGYYPTEEQIKELNDDTIKRVAEYSGICHGFCFLNPANDTDFCISELDRCIKKHGFRGVKFEVSINCRSEKLDPVMRRIEELNVPLLHHCWYKTVGKCDEESDPSDIAYLAAKFPKVKIIMAHLAGCRHLGVENIARLPNVYIDTSGGQSIAGLVEYAVRRVGASRIVFGSDAPYRDISCQLGRIYGADIDDVSKQKILCDNAKELLNL